MLLIQIFHITQLVHALYIKHFKPKFRSLFCQGLQPNAHTRICVCVCACVYEVKPETPTISKTILDKKSNGKNGCSSRQCIIPIIISQMYFVDSINNEPICNWSFWYTPRWNNWKKYNFACFSISPYAFAFLRLSLGQTQACVYARNVHKIHVDLLSYRKLFDI